MATQYSPAVIQALLDGPADTPPVGMTSDFNVKPPYNNQGNAIVAVCAALVIAVGLLRAYSRLKVTNTVFLEDYLALVGFASYIGFVVALFDYIRLGGLFVHQWDIQMGNMLDLTLRLYIYSVCYTVSMGFVKAAILLEWRRIFCPRGTRDTFFWAAIALLVINVLLYAGGGIAVICSCVPPRKYWYPFIDGSCIDRREVDTVAGSINLFTDFGIFVLPQRKIWNLQMNNSRKIGLAVIFSFGLLSCASGIGRIASTVEAVYPTPNTTGDSSYTASPQLLWCLAELTCVHLVFCIPMVRGAFSEKTFLGRGAAALWSWRTLLSSRSSPGKGSDSSFQKSWPKIKDMAPQERGHRLYDRESDGHAVGLVDLEYCRTATGLSTSTSRYQTLPSDRTILKTTEVVQHDYIPRRESNAHQNLQHPWTEQDR